MNAHVRRFDSGATRDLDVNKLDYEAFLCPRVLERYAQFMHRNRHLADGTLRDGDNWQRGIPAQAYMKSAFRHFHDWWKEHRGIATDEGLENSICALMFNAMGYLHEHLKAKASVADSTPVVADIATGSPDALVSQLQPPQPATIANDD